MALAPDYAESLVRSLAPLADARCEGIEQLDRVVPAQAGVGNALSKSERASGHEVLAAFAQVRFDHHADDAALAAGDLPADVAPDLCLTAVVLGGIRVRAVDHQALGQLRACELRARGSHRVGVVVRLL